MSMACHAVIVINEWLTYLPDCGCGRYHASSSGFTRQSFEGLMGTLRLIGQSVLPRQWWMVRVLNLARAGSGEMDAARGPARCRVGM